MFFLPEGRFEQERQPGTWSHESAHNFCILLHTYKTGNDLSGDMEGIYF